MKKPAVTVSAALVSAIAIAVGSGASAQPLARLGAEDLAPGLLRAPSEADIAASRSLASPLSARIDAGSLRIAGTDKLGQYMLASAQDKREVCMLLTTSSARPVTIGSCAKTEDFYDIGLRLDTGGSAIGRNLVVFLLPKGVDATPLKLLPGVSYVGTGKGNQQIIASTTPEEIPARLELRRDLGPAFEFDGVKRVVGAVR